MSFDWRRRLSSGLGLRIGLWYAAIFATSAVLLGGATYALLSAVLQQRDQEIVVSTLREYAARYEAGGLLALARAVDLEQRSGRHERLFVRVLGAGRDALFISLPPEWGEFDVDRLGADGADRSGGWSRAPARGREALLEVASARVRDGSIIQVGKSTENRSELLRQFRTVAILASTLMIIVGLAGGVVLTRSTLRPVRNLADVVRGIVRTGRTEARVPVPESGDAIAELSTLFNAMLDRINTLIGAMRDSLDNVAHDLRTPLTRLRGLAERALASGDAAEQREALADCIEQSDRILAVLNTLMDISEAETGALRLRTAPVALDALVGEVVGLYDEVADDKQIEVTVHAAQTVVAMADRDRLRQALANLLDNALKYTGRGGRVVIETQAGDGRATIMIRDTGAGIAPDELPRIWERLYRGDRSRAERGLGLGLSLVRAYIVAQGGEVTAASIPGEGSTFTVRLPLARP